MTEACVLADRWQRGAAAEVIAFARETDLQGELRMGENLERLAELLRQHRDLPMSVADARLARYAERLREGRSASTILSAFAALAGGCPWS